MISILVDEILSLIGGIYIPQRGRAAVQKTHMAVDSLFPLPVSVCMFFAFIYPYIFIACEPNLPAFQQYDTYHLRPVEERPGTNR